MIKRSFFILTLCLLCLVGFSSGVMAQEGLSADDAALLESANATSSAFETVHFDINLGFSAEASGDTVTADLAVVGDLGTSGVLQFDVFGEIAQGDQSLPVDMGLLLNQFDLYVRGLNEALEIEGPADAWAYLDIASMLPMLGAMTGMGDMSTMDTSDPSALMESLMGSVGGSMDMSALEGMDFDPESYVSYSRAADDEMGRAHFTIDIALGDLLTDLAPLMSEMGDMSMLGSITGMSGGGSMTPEEAEQAAEQMEMMVGVLAMALQDGTYQVNQYVNTATGFVERTHVVVDLDLTQMLGPEQGVKLNLDLDINLSDYNAPLEVSAPTNTVNLMGSS